MSVTNMLALDNQGRAIVTALGGHWMHGQGMARCPAHDDHTPSLSIRVGYRALLFKCFAGCTYAEIVASLRRRHFDNSAPVSAAPAPQLVRQDYHAIALRLWLAAGPLEGSLAETYLAGRSVTVRTDALRYHPRTPAGRGRNVRFRPALLAAITEGDRIVAIQRTFLGKDGRLASDMKHPKLCLGRPGQGAVALFKPRRVLGLAEGIENAISAARRFQLPVWAVLGAERMDKVAIPASVERLMLFPDKDRAGRRAVARMRAKYLDRRVDLRVLWPPAPHQDWNEAWMEEGSEEREGCGQRPGGQAAPQGDQL